MSQYFSRLRAILKKDTLDDFSKTYFLDVTDELKIKKEHYNTNDITPVYIKLEILKHKSNVRYTVSLSSWSNENKNYVAIENSFLKDSKRENLIEDIASEYDSILINFRDVFAMY